MPLHVSTDLTLNTHRVQKWTSLARLFSIKSFSNNVSYLESDVEFQPLVDILSNFPIFRNGGVDLFVCLLSINCMKKTKQPNESSVDLQSVGILSSQGILVNLSFRRLPSPLNYTIHKPSQNFFSRTPQQKSIPAQPFAKNYEGSRLRRQMIDKD